MNVSASPLGKQTAYSTTYQPDLLFPIPRKEQREKSGITEPLPFKGVDIWNAFEVSWLNDKGKPKVALGEFHIPCDSPCLIESKSFKLYLNSFNQTRFSSQQEVTETLTRDLSSKGQKDVSVILSPLTEGTSQHLDGQSLDDLDITIETYDVSPQLLQLENTVVEETLTTDLFKSNCPITGQPDWASVSITYQGPKMQREALLRYLISYRNHQGFHEDSTERIFIDLLNTCHPEQLTVYTRYTRRGGLDINCIRTTTSASYTNIRTPRQ